MHDEAQRRNRLRALRLYTLLLRLYPRAHRQAFGLQMQQTFVDHYRDVEHSTGRVGITFWLGVLVDAVRSIGGEHLAVVHSVIGRWEIWPYVPSGVILSGAIAADAAGERNALLACTLVAALVFAATSSAGIVPKAMTCAAALGVVLYGSLLASLTGQWRDLFDPIVLLVTLFFGAKTASGIQARLVGTQQTLWNREELRWGTLVAVLLLVACVVAVLPPEDAWAGLALLLGLGSPTLCGAAAARVSRATTSTQAGCFASVAALAIGLVLWIMSLPLLFVLITWITEGTMPGNHSMVPSTLHLWQISATWGQALYVIPRFLAALLLMGGLAGFFGAICAFSLIDDETQRVVPSAARAAKPYGTCATCGAQSWEETITCWCCGRQTVV